MEKIAVKKGIVRLRIPEIMKERGLTLVELTGITGFMYNTVRAMALERYERVGLNTIAVLCDTLGVEPGDLFEYKPGEVGGED